VLLNDDIDYYRKGNVMKLLAALILLLTACAPMQARKPTCVPTAVMCALTYASKPVLERGERLVLGQAYPVRLVTGATKDPRIGHMQAQAFIAGEWRWLAYDGVHCIVVDDHDWWFIPKEVWDIGQGIEIVVGKLKN
jgi:hypothetical protein